MQNTIEIVCGMHSKVIRYDEAQKTELSSYILYMKTKDDTWKIIRDKAYNLYYTSAIVFVPPCVYNQFPLKNWREYE